MKLSTNELLNLTERFIEAILDYYRLRVALGVYRNKWNKYMIPSEYIKKIVWQKAITVRGYDPDIVRKDACGAWIVYTQFGDRSKPFGWEIDHICPEMKLHQIGVSQQLIDDSLNLRALHWRNNASKGYNYPSYIASVKADNDRNKMVEIPMEVNTDLQAQLNRLYNL